MRIVVEFRLDCWVSNGGGAPPFDGTYAVARIGVRNLTQTMLITDGP
jgi:hypothetical protein